jgi:hypothetical protein
MVAASPGRVNNMELVAAVPRRSVLLEHLLLWCSDATRRDRS